MTTTAATDADAAGSGAHPRFAAALEELDQAVRTLDELRLANLQAIGFERKRKPPKK